MDLSKRICVNPPLILSLLPCVIRRACEWTRLHVMESQAHSDFAPAFEFFWSNIALDRQTFLVGLQVLADGHDVAGDGAQVFHQLDNFIKSLAEAHHDAALR